MNRFCPLDEATPGLIVPLIARVRQGISIDLAERELDLRIAALKRDGVSAWQQATVDLGPLASVESQPPRQALLALWGASAFVLLLAGANIGNLMLARPVAAEDATRIHAFVGATRWRLARMFLVEGLLSAERWPASCGPERIRSGVAHAATGAYRVVGVASGVRMERFTYGVPDYQMYLPPRPADIGTTVLVRTMGPRDMMQTLIALTRSIDATRVVALSGAKCPSSLNFCLL
jgi:hypothetical protein